MSLKDDVGWKIFMTCHVYLTKNPIPADIIHLHNPDFQHLSVLHCPKRGHGLILGRAISGLTAAQTESLFSGKRLFLGGEKKRVCVHRCVDPSSPESLLHILSLSVFDCHLPLPHCFSFIVVCVNWQHLSHQEIKAVQYCPWQHPGTLEEEEEEEEEEERVLQAVSLWKKKKKTFHSTTVCGNSPPISHFHTDSEFLPRVLWIEALVHPPPPHSHKASLSLAWNNRGLLSRKKKKTQQTAHYVFCLYPPFTNKADRM